MVSEPVACIMLTYNNFEHIYESIDSVLEQDYPSIEFGIFDDHSEYFPLEQIKEYIENKKKENIVRLVIEQNPENYGTVKNFNHAIRKINGKYIFDTTPDDLFDSNHALSDLTKWMDSHESLVVTTYRKLMTKDGSVMKVEPNKRTFIKFTGMSAYKQFKWIATGVNIAGPGTVYSRKLIEAVDYFDESYRLQEDGPMLLKITRSGYHIDGANLYYMRYRLGSGVSSADIVNDVLVKDVRRMLKKEVIPYIDEFNMLEKRKIKYQIERLSRNERNLRWKEKVLFALKYPDVFVHRVLLSK